MKVTVGVPFFWMSYDIVITNMHKKLKNLITENVCKGICTLVSFQADFAQQITLKLENPEGSRLVGKKIVRSLPQDCVKSLRDPVF